MGKKLIQDIYAVFKGQNKLDQKAQELISSYESALQSLSFIEKEKEMRIKFPELWKMQCEKAKNHTILLKNQLIDFGSKYDIDVEQIFKNYTDKKLNLEDFTKLY